MIDKLKENILQIAEKIEAVYSDHQLQREELRNDNDLTAAAKRRQAWELYEKAKARAEELSQQGLKEVGEARDLLSRQLAQAKADNEEADPGKRAKVEALKEQLEAELIAAGPFEYLKELSRFIEGDNCPLHLEAARAVLPSLKASLYTEMYSKETGGQVFNPWGDSEGAVSSDNSQLIKVELQDLARRLSDTLKPEAVKKHEVDISTVKDFEMEISGAFARTTRLLNTAKPSGPESGRPWDPEELEKSQEAII